MQLPAIVTEYLDLTHELEEAQKLSRAGSLENIEEVAGSIEVHLCILRFDMTDEEYELAKTWERVETTPKEGAFTMYKTIRFLIAFLILALLASIYGVTPRDADASFVAVGYGPFTPETQNLVEAECGYSMAESAFYEHTQTRKGYLAMLKAHNGVDDLYTCVKVTTRVAEESAPEPDYPAITTEQEAFYAAYEAEAAPQTEAEWFSIQPDEYRFAHMNERPYADPGMTWAEDGTQVPYSYYDVVVPVYESSASGYIQAEDGSYVNPDFYSKTDYNANGITDQEEGYPPNPNPASVQ